MHFKVIDTPDYEGEEYPSYFKLLKGKLKIPVGSERQLRLATDVEDNYFVRKEGRGTIEFPQLSKISFLDFKLADGFLNIVVKHNGSEVEKIPNLIIGISDDTANRFEIEVPVEIIPPQLDEDLKLPKLMSVEKSKWADFEPEYTVDEIARIPNWQELKRIEVNIDSLAFNELAQMQVTDRERAKKVLRNQMFFISIWLYFELKDYVEHDNSGFTRDQVFNRSL
ncbi:hypothetical protein IID04_02430, partial [PVC group bacterium]|nr:hypothetical protein [PVC group bacterium]